MRGSRWALCGDMSKTRALLVAGGSGLGFLRRSRMSVMGGGRIQLMRDSAVTLLGIILPHVDGPER